MTSASYMYAIARSFDPSRVAGLHGVDGEKVYLVRHRDLVAVVSPLRSEDAEQGALKARLESLPELSAMVRAHHGVVEAVAACSVTLPLRLATIQHGDDRVTEALRREYPVLAAALDHLANHVELGVKLYLDASALCPQDRLARRDPAGSGRDYLRQRREQRDEREQTGRLAVASANELDVVLTGLAVDRCQHPNQDSRLGGTAGENILNVAYLVEAGRAGELAERARVMVAAVPHLTVEVTGPWAPYSFAATSERIGSDPGPREEEQT